MKQVLASLLLAVFLMSCGGGGTRFVPPDQKMGTILKRNVDNSAPDEMIPFTGFCTSNISDEMQTEIRATGIEITKLVENYFVANGTKDQVYAIAKLTFVQRLEGTNFGTFRK